MRSELIGTSGLAAAGVVALLLTLARTPRASDPGSLRRAVLVLIIGLLFQAVHFTEELVTGFHHRFPQLLGLEPWSVGFFVTFNVAAMVVWTISALGLRANYRAAYFPAWFFAIAAILNGITHPVLAIASRGYFPGLLTSLPLGIAGIVLWVRLQNLTSFRE